MKHPIEKHRIVSQFLGLSSLTKNNRFYITRAVLQNPHYQKCTSLNIEKHFKNYSKVMKITFVQVQNHHT